LAVHLKIATLFEHYGPYHVARINGAIKNCGRHEIVPIELFGKCQTYAWTKPAHSEIDSHVVFPQLDSVSASKPQIRTGIAGLLDDLKPDVVAVHGWSLPGATETIRWANRNGASVVVMSESRAEDSPRSAAKEFVKRKILGHVSSGLVGAPSHAAYLAQLGIPNDAIFQGYNAVDNDYFAIETKRIRAEKSSDTMPHLPFSTTNYRSTMVLHPRLCTLAPLSNGDWLSTKLLHRVCRWLFLNRRDVQNAWSMMASMGFYAIRWIPDQSREH